MLEEVVGDIAVARPEGVHQVFGDVHADHRNALAVSDEPFGVAPFAAVGRDLERIERTADDGIFDIVKFL